MSSEQAQSGAAGDPPGSFTGPISEHERAYLVEAMRRRLRDGKVLSLYIGALMVGLFGFFAYLFGEFGIGWSIGFGLAAVGTAVFMLWPVSAPDPDTRLYRVEIFEGAHSWRIVGAGKGKERKELIGGRFVEVPPHWLRTVKNWGPMQVRAALPSDVPADGPHLGYDLLAIAGGPSIERERAAGLGPRPPFTALLALGLIAALLGVVVPAGVFVSAAGDGQITLAEAASAVRRSFAGPVDYPAAAALLANPPQEGARVRVETAYLLRADFIESASPALRSSHGYYLLTEATRDRVLASRDEGVAARYRRAWAAYEEEQAIWRRRAGPFFGFDPTGRPALRRNLPPAPKAPRPEPVKLVPGEAAALLEELGGARLAPMVRGTDPVQTLLSRTTPVAGVFAAPAAELGAPPRLTPLRDFEEARSYGFFLLFGLGSLALLLGLGWRAGAILRRQSAYAARAAEIHAAAGAPFRP